MKTIDEVLNSWNAEYIADNPHNFESYNKADVLEWLAQKQLLQQTPSTTELELLEQMLLEEQIGYMKSKNSKEADTRLFNEDALKVVIKLINVRQQIPSTKTVCHICGGENGHTIECTSWCGKTVTV